MFRMCWLMGVTILLLVGCSTATDSIVDQSAPDLSSKLGTVTFHVPGMNQRLQILWGDWPNKVKQALVELEGVESIEDEWERELESEQDLDLLFVTYQKDHVTIAKMQETMQILEFKSEVKED